MFNDYGILASASCQLGFFSDGVEPKMRQQRELGSYSSLSSSRDCRDFTGVAECRVHSAQESELSAHQIPVPADLRTGFPR